MTLEAQFVKDAGVVDFVTAVALNSGQVLQLPDGRAGVVTGAGRGFAVNDTAAAQVEGLFSLAKTASIVLLAGQQVFWNKSTNKVSYTGDFAVGVVTKAAAASDTTVDVALNTEPSYVIELGKGLWTEASVDGLGVSALTYEGRMLSFDAVAEAAMAAIYSADTIPVAAKPILEAWIGIFDIGDDGALDISVGLANGTHATDADSITESVFVHLDGNALDILAESDDGSTEVAATDTTIDAVDDTYFFMQIDASDLADVKIYINGLRVLAASTFVLTDATGPLMPLVHIEKTSNDTLADVRVKSLHVRTGLNT